MKASQLDFIRHLSVSDTKNLVQKALKVQEECGDLAKAILPYSNAPGTLHRIIGREKILEEAVDTILCAISIAYDLEFSDAEIESMFDRKTAKWADLQAAERDVKFPLPFEIHITVQEADVSSFRSTCADLGVKPIVLDLQTRAGGIVNDVMTSSVFHGDNSGSLAEVKRIADGLRSAGYKVVREKIETVPAHPAAPTEKRQGSFMPAGCYFEAHLQIVCNDERKPLLDVIASGSGAHLSRNAFKALEGGHYIIMLTHRAYTGTIEAFKADVERISRLLKTAGFDVGKEIVEFAILDTRCSHDAEWLGH